MLLRRKHATSEMAYVCQISTQARIRRQFLPGMVCRLRRDSTGGHRGFRDIAVARPLLSMGYDLRAHFDRSEFCRADTRWSPAGHSCVNPRDEQHGGRGVFADPHRRWFEGRFRPSRLGGCCLFSVWNRNATRPPRYDRRAGRDADRSRTRDLRRGGLAGLARGTKPTHRACVTVADDSFEPRYTGSQTGIGRHEYDRRSRIRCAEAAR